MELAAEMGPLSLASVAGVVLIGAFIQGAIGIGFGLFVAPLVAVIEPRLVPALVLTLGIFSTVHPAIKGRRHIVAKELGLGVAGRILGVISAAAVFSYIVDLQTLNLTFGLIVLLAVVLSLTPFRLAFTNANLFAASIASGAMGTFVGIGGPPMGIIYQNANAAKIRATLNAFFGIGSALSFVALASFGSLGTAHFFVAALVSPALIAGSVAAGFIKTSSGGGIRAALLVVCTISSIILVLRGLGLA